MLYKFDLDSHKSENIITLLKPSGFVFLIKSKNLNRVLRVLDKTHLISLSLIRITLISWLETCLWLSSTSMRVEFDHYSLVEFDY